MIISTTVTQPAKLKTVVQAKKQSVSVATPGGQIEVTQVTQGLSGVGNDKSYVHTQSLASIQWTVNHNLGKYPSVTIVDSAGDEVEGNVNHIGLNQLVISFSAAFGGRAFIN